VGNVYQVDTSEVILNTYVQATNSTDTDKLATAKRNYYYYYYDPFNGLFSRQPG